MARLRDLTKLIRSKNAGPFSLTFDFMFDNVDSYRRVRDSGVITRELFSQLYRTPVEDVEIYSVDAAKGIKVTIPRPMTQGDLKETDQLGGQQWCPLLEVEIPD
jgi:hypothetical protein